MKTKYLIKKILRKIYHFIGFMTIFMICLLPVKADTIVNIQYGGSNYSESYYLNNLPYTYWFDSNDLNTTYQCSSLNDCYTQAISYFNSLNYDYYSISLDIEPQNNNIGLVLYYFNFSSSDNLYQHVYSSGSNIDRFYFSNSSSYVVGVYSVILSGWSDPYRNNFYRYYDSNFTFINHDDYIFSGFYDNENNNYNNMLQVHDNDPMPKIKDLLNYSSWSDYYNNNMTGYTTVNLDDYDYVLLSLKNYNQSNAFQSNLQVKGQIGITPIYNYGQTSKDSVTGSQVQDRCNASYSDYTSYPLYILQSDLQNNVVYAVKSCSENSSFKFDTTVFDITYVTQQNVSDPIITINGQQYHTIPYNDLPSSATKNETDNYIPGESYNFVDSGIDSLNSALKQSGNWLSSIWSTITYFTQFIGLIFSSLPSELHAILISAFTITIIIGLIKHFTS